MQYSDDFTVLITLGWSC